MGKGWITKAEIAKILDTYSVHKNEFIQVSKMNNSYKSTFVDGYIINVSKEPDPEIERIHVAHTQDGGIRTYVDIWERSAGGKLEFRFRNLQGQPVSDAKYIKELEQENAELKQAGRELKQAKKELERENGELKQAKKELRAQLDECQKLIDDTDRWMQQIEQRKPKHNERGAGRKPSKERLDAIARMQVLLESGAGEQEIKKALGISRATFYRYKRSIKN